MMLRIATRLIVSIASLALVSCSESPLTTDTYSSKFNSDQQKIEFLAKYLELPAPVEATEFHIVYHDNSGILPGPSDWTIQAIIKTSPSQLRLWTAAMQQQPSTNLDWGYRLLPKNEQRWQLKSQPKIYRRSNSNVYVAIFESEGIIFKSVDSGI